jgi:hypothetical protein
MEPQGVYHHNPVMDEITRARQMLIGGLEAMIHDFNFTEILISHLVAENNAQSKEAFKMVIGARLDKHRQSVEDAYEKIDKLEELIKQL